MQGYQSDELGSMALAQNYYRWIMGKFRPHLGKVVCEFGAGIGTFSSLLLDEDIHQLILLTLAKRMKHQAYPEDQVFQADTTIMVLHYLRKHQ